MKKQLGILFLVAAATLADGTTEPVYAEGGFFNNLFNGGQRNRNRQAAAAQSGESRSIQTALNFFEFDAGVADGVLGNQSRAAVSAFQEALGLPETGQLTDEEKGFLLSSYSLIADGSEEMNWQVLSNEEGALGVLKTLYLEENPFADVTTTPVAPPLHSMRLFCVNIDAAGPIDLVKAQFCNLRGLAIGQAEFLVESSPNPQTLSQVLEKCGNFAETMAPYTANIPQSQSVELVEEMAAWAGDSGMPEDTLSRIAKICLGAGYKGDNAEVALATLLALSGLDEPIYKELMSYHIAFGLGFEGELNYPLATDWLENTIENLPEGNLTLTGQDSDQRAIIIDDIINILEVER